MESAREKIGITVYYWSDIEAIKAGKMEEYHQKWQEKGKMKWYHFDKVRIAYV